MTKELEQFRQIMMNFERNLEKNPDKVAQQHKTAKYLNLPKQVVYDDEELATLRSYADSAIAETQGSPVTRQRLTDSDFHAVAKDDTKNLAAIEQNIRQYGSVTNAPDLPWYKELFNSMRHGFSIGQSAATNTVSNWDLLGLQKQRQKVAQAQGISYTPSVEHAIAIEDAMRKADRFAPSNGLIEKQKRLAELNKGGSFKDTAKYILSNPSLIANTMAESMGMAAPTLAASAAAGMTGNPFAAAAVAGAGSASLEYMTTVNDVVNEYADTIPGYTRREKLYHVLNNPELMDKAREKAAKRGIAVGTFDALTAGFAGKLLAGAKGGVLSAGSRALGELGIQAGGGAAGEAVAQALTGEYKPADILMEAIAELPTGVAEIPGNYREARTKVLERRAAQVQAELQNKQAMDAAAQESRLAKRDPEMFADAVSEMAQSAGVTHFYVDAQELHQSGMADAAVAASPSIAAQYQEALQTGGSIAVPVGEYVAKIGTHPELAKSFDNITRYAPDGDSIADVQAFEAQNTPEQMQAEMQRQMQAAENERSQDAQVSAIEEAIYSDLQAAGRFDASTNRTQAQVAANLFRVTAQRLDIPVQDLWQRFGLKVQGAETAQGALQQPVTQNHEWEYGQRKGLFQLPDVPVAQVRGDEFGTDEATIRQGALQHIQQYRQDGLHNQDTGWKLEISKDDVSKLVKWYGTDKTALQAQAALKDIVNNAVLAESHQDTQHNNPDVLAVHRLYAPVRIGDKVYRAKLTVRDYQSDRVDSKTRLHALTAVEIENAPMGTFPTTPDAEHQAGTGQPTSAHAMSIADLLQGASREHGEAWDTSADNQLYQQADNPSFAETAQALGGEEAYRAARDAGQTELDYQQWVQVRTPEFKKWFGDWENDPDNASKVINERTGEPLVVYHGTQSQFDTFDTPLNMQRIFLTTDKAFAQKYGKTVMPLFANARNVIHVDYQGQSAFDEIDVGSETLGDIEELADYALVQDYDGAMVSNVEDIGTADSQSSVTNEVIVFDPNQIKSATANSGAFDAGNENIYYQLDENVQSAFTEAVDKVAAGETLDNNVSLGTTPDVLRLLGLPEVEVFVSPSVLHKVMLGKHQVAPADLKQLPKQLNNPVAVMKSHTVPDAYVMLTELTEHNAKEGIDEPVIAALHFKRNEQGIDLLNIASVYGKNLPGLQTMLSEDLLYWNETKGSQILQQLTLQLRPPIAENANLSETDTNAGAGGQSIITDKDLRAYQLKQSFRQQQQGGSKPRGAFNPQTLAITLTPNADLSTFTHELGHFAFEMHTALAAELQAKKAAGEQLPVTQRQMIEDMETAARWLGLRDLNHWHSLSFEEKRPLHEQMARGFEAYIFEGNAPNAGMRRVFQRLRAWMVSVYKKLSSLNVKLSDDVRRVFDRMVATDEEIAFAEQNRSLMPLFANAETAGMSAEEFAQYHNDVQTADSQARETLARKAVRDMKYLRNARNKHLRKLQKQADFLRREAEREVTREVMREPVYQVWQRLAARMTDNDRVDTDSRPKFNKYVDNRFDSLFTAIAKLGGVNKDELVSQWGFDPKDKIPAVAVGYPVVRRGKGRSLDAMLEALAEQGYLPLDENGKADIHDFEERFFDELRGDTQYSNAYVPQMPKAGEDVTTPVWAVRLDEGSLYEMGLTEDEINVLRERKMVQKTGGWHPDLLAGMVLDEDALPYYGSGEALVRDVLSAEPPRAVIERLADEKLLREHGEVATQKALEEAADAAVFDKVRVRVLAHEYNALAKQSGLPSLVQKAAQEYAERAIGALPLNDVKPHLYRRMAAKAAKAAETAMRKGDIQAAAKEKRNQMIQAALAEAAQDALNRADKIRQQFSDWGSRTRSRYAKTHDVGMVEAVKVVIGTYGVAVKKGEKAAEYIDRLKQYDAASYEQVQNLINRAFADVDANGRHKTVFDMSVDELQGLYDELKSVMSYARRSKQVEIDGRMQSREEVVAQLSERLKQVKPQPKDLPQGRSLTDGERARLNMHTLYYSGRRVESWARALGQPFTDYIFQPVKQGAEAYRKDAFYYKEKFKELLEPIQKDFEKTSLSGSLKKKVAGRFGIQDKAQIAAPEIGYTFSGMNELLHALLHTGNESNKRKLLLGRQWGVETPTGELSTVQWDTLIQRLIQEGKLKKEHFDFVQGVWDLMEEMKPKAQEAHKQVFGHYFDEITAQGFDTPFGHYRGGYVPAVCDPQLVFDQQLRDLLNNENDNLAYAFPQTNRSFTHGRVEYNRPLLLDMRVLMQHIDKVAMFSNLEVPVRDVQRIVHDLGGELNRYQKGAVEGMLMPWLNRVAKQRVSAPAVGDGGMSRVFTAMRSRAGMGLMFLNVSNTVQQLSGFALANVRVPSKYMLGAAADFVRHPKQLPKDVAAASDFMNQRMSNEISAMNDFIQETLIHPTALQKMRNWTNRNAYFLQSAMANTMEPIIWKAAYQHALDSGKTEAQAARAADSVIRETQGSTLPEDVSRMETGPAWARLFTQFWGYFNMNANLLKTEFEQILHEGGLAKNKMRAAHLFLMGYFIPAAVAEAIAHAFSGGGDDDGDGDYLDDWIHAALITGPLRTLAAMVPFAGQAGLAVYDNATGKPYGGRLTSSPAITMLESAAKAPTSVYKAVAEHGSGRAAVKDTGSLITMVLGIPAYAAARPTGYWADVEQNRIRPTGTIDALRGSITGTPSKESRM